MIVRFAACALLAILIACGDEAPVRKPPRHVVLLVVDTLRADHLTPYGYPRETAPHLAAFAKEAVLFERAISQGAWTSPSMVSMMSSSYLGAETPTLPAAKSTIAEVFQKAGWTTGAFVFNDVLNPACGFNRGFDSYPYKDPPYGSNAAIAEWFTANKDHRTFTWIHLNEAHDPYGSLDGKWPAGAPTPFVGRPDSITPEHRAWLEQYAKQRQLADPASSLEHIRQEIGAYDDDVAWSDARIQGIFDAIRAAGLWDDSAVVIAADHGEGLWTREFYMTGTRLNATLRGEPPSLVTSLHQTHGSQVNYELVHVPLIIKAPGLPKARRVDSVVENVDIAPTLFELCDLPAPTGMQGTSLVPLAEGSSAARALQPAFSHTRFASSLIGQDGMQLIHPTENGVCAFGLVDELYDLRKDPQARTNIAPQRPELVAKMTEEIRARLKSGLRDDGGPLSPETQNSLNQLGYLDTGVVDTLRVQLDGQSTAELLKQLANQGGSCLTRVELVRALAQHKLTDEERAQLSAQLARETMAPVKTALETLLTSK